jgi:hypothetical protein
MDALRFMRGGAAAPQPPVAPASVPPPPQYQRQPRRAAMHAPLLRLRPRGGGGREKPAAAGSAVRGAEARSSPEEEAPVEAGERGQGNWVLQMLRVQPRWEEAAHAEATGEGGDHESGSEREAPSAGGGVEECASCGGDEGCAVGYDEDDHASFSRLLKKVSLAEVREYSKMSYLCNIAYMIPKIQVGSSELLRFFYATISPHEFLIRSCFKQI